MRVIFATIMVFAFAFPALVAADGFGANECPDGKFLFVEQPIISNNKTLFAAVLIKGEKLASETHLHRRADGWTNLSSEQNLFEKFQSVSQCLPMGTYMIRIEFYTHIPAIGEWLLGSFNYDVILDQHFYAADTQRIRGEYHNATLKDNTARTWHLLLFYFVSVALIVNSVFITVRYVIRARKGKQR